MAFSTPAILKYLSIVDLIFLTNKGLPLLVINTYFEFSTEGLSFVKYLFKVSAAILLIGIFLASLLFFLISNFGVWLNWYPRTTEGLVHCYLLALPFYGRTLMGDLSFGYGYLLLRQLVKKYQHHFLVPDKIN